MKVSPHPHKKPRPQRDVSQPRNQPLNENSGRPLSDSVIRYVNEDNCGGGDYPGGDRGPRFIVPVQIAQNGESANNPTMPKCSPLGPLGVTAAGLSLASQWTGTGYTLGVNFNKLFAQVAGADIAVSIALVSDSRGNVGIARSVSVTPSVGYRSYGGGLTIGASTFSDLSGYSSYSKVNFTATVAYGLATGLTVSSSSSGFSTTAYVGYTTPGASAGANGLSLTNNVQPFCKQ